MQRLRRWLGWGLVLAAALGSSSASPATPDVEAPPAAGAVLEPSPEGGYAALLAAFERPEFSDRLAAADALATALQAGSQPDAALAAQIANRMCAELRGLSDLTQDTLRFVSLTTQTLLLLSDERALDIVLTDEVVTSNLKIFDGWVEDSDAEFMAGLARSYREDRSNPGNASRALLYELMAERRRAGRRIRAENPVIDMVTFKALGLKKP